MRTITLKVTGMTCGHCVAAVTKALQNIPGVESVDVNLEQGRALIKGEADNQTLVNAVKEEGYEAEVVA